MKISINALLVNTPTGEITIPLTRITFIHGPIGKGKSSIARLIDYCFGGQIERTVAVQKEFLSVTMFLKIGGIECRIERSANDRTHVRFSWKESEKIQSFQVPISAHKEAVFGNVFNVSDLVYQLAGVQPVHIRQSSIDPDSKLIRLGFRDLWPFSYLQQHELDSSFFRFKEKIVGRNSVEAMKYFLGLHSERQVELETELLRLVEQQRSKRVAVDHIRSFMKRFGFGSESEVQADIQKSQSELKATKTKVAELEIQRRSQTHPSDKLRELLRESGDAIMQTRQSLQDSLEVLDEQNSLRAEYYSAQFKAIRAEEASRILDGVTFCNCPACGSSIADRETKEGECILCFSRIDAISETDHSRKEKLRLDLNDRIDELTQSIARRQTAIQSIKHTLELQISEKTKLDQQLQEELERYDSAFVEQIRMLERMQARLTERISNLKRLLQMPKSVNLLIEEAGSLQGIIDVKEKELESERARLSTADKNLKRLAEVFKQTLLEIGFPGVATECEVYIGRDMIPYVVQEEIVWSFWNAGSGGKKVLFNVAFSVALHVVADELGLPVPTVLIIDSPHKNISKDENPKLVEALFKHIYDVAVKVSSLQVILIESELYEPTFFIEEYSRRFMAGTDEAPALFPNFRE